jgi:hypothetical protein
MTRTKLWRSLSPPLWDYKDDARVNYDEQYLQMP